MKSQIGLQRFSRIPPNSIQNLEGVVLGPGPVRGPWAREKPTLGIVENRQRSPRCPRVSLQRVKKADMDLPEMHHSPVRSEMASRWNEMHLGEVHIGKFHPLWRLPGASGGALAIPRGS